MSLPENLLGAKIIRSATNHVFNRIWFLIYVRGYSNRVWKQFPNQGRAFPTTHTSNDLCTVWHLIQLAIGLLFKWCKARQRRIRGIGQGDGTGSRLVGLSGSPWLARWALSYEQLPVAITSSLPLELLKSVEYKLENNLVSFG